MLIKNLNCPEGLQEVLVVGLLESLGLPAEELHETLKSIFTEEIKCSF